MFDFVLLIISAALVNNLLLGQALAADSLRAPNLRHIGSCLALLLALAAPCAWALHWLLQLAALEHLFLLFWVICAALLALLCQRVLLPAQHSLWPQLCANALAIAYISQSQVSVFFALALGLGGGLGLWLALALLHDLHTRLSQLTLARALQGTPMLLICTGLMSLAFMGFSGMTGA